MNTKDDKVKEAIKLLTTAFENPGNMFAGSTVAVAFNKLKEALAPEPRFYKGQPVLVSDNQSHNYIRGYFCGYRDEKHREYEVIIGGGKYSYGYCKPDPDAESIINWIEHDGSDDSSFRVGPDELAITIDTKGVHHFFTGPDNVFLNKVARYAIIPLPEFLS